MSITSDSRIPLGKYVQRKTGKVVYVIEVLPPDPKRFKGDWPVLRIRWRRGAYYEARNRSAQRFLAEYERVEG